MKEPKWVAEIKAKRAIQLRSHNDKVLMRDEFIYVDEVTDEDKKLVRQGAIIITELKRKTVKITAAGENVKSYEPKGEDEEVEVEKTTPTTKKPTTKKKGGKGGKTKSR